jgi:nitroreductase
MLLAAESMDIGSCWLGSGRFFFQNNENVAKLNLPNGYEPYYIIALGYKKSQYNEAHEINKNVVNYIK